ncbi:MAG: helix-turn-helix transcriptional regulator [Planctomycetes bacterium]|nr:helix-turn-helix transcriptional regulator [Planctomycetota bacterium]
MPKTISDIPRTTIRRDPRSQSRLASDANVDPSVISRFMRSERSPGLDVIDRLCGTLRLRLVLKGSPKPPGKRRT